MTTPSDGWIRATISTTPYRTEIETRTHRLAADEPLDAGGADAGPTPYELLLGALAACTAMTLRMYADRKGWPLESVVVRLRPIRVHATDCVDCETKEVGTNRLEREIDMIGALSGEQRKRMLYIADRCPVKQSVERGIRIEAVGS